MRISLGHFLAVPILAGAIATGDATAARSDESAESLLHAAASAMGGEDALRAIRSVQFRATLQRNALEQSERPEGPYISELVRVTEWRDHERRRWRQARDSEFAWLKSSTTAIVADGVAAHSTGDRVLPASGQDRLDADESLDLGPERVLLTALANQPHRLPDALLHAVPQRVVGFRWQDRAVRIYISADTNLPTTVEWTGGSPYDPFWSVWGDVTTRVSYSLWWLAPGAIHYPLQYDVVRNGLSDFKLTIRELSLNTALDDRLFEIPESVRQEFTGHQPTTIDERPLPIRNSSELAPGVILIRGSWNTTLVRQDDGVVIVEAPISSGYSSQVIAEATRRFPGMRIKAVISTSDSWPHVGGVREYVARGIPIYVLDRTRPLLERMVKAQRTSFPDALAKAPRTPMFIEVHGRAVVGAGANRIEIYPIRGQTTERQMIAYWPEHRLLYGSDAFQKQGGEYFYPQTVSEVRDAVAREHLAVDTFFMMHMPVTPWTEARAVRGGPIPAS